MNRFVYLAEKFQYTGLPDGNGSQHAIISDKELLEYSDFLWDLAQYMIFRNDSTMAKSLRVEHEQVERMIRARKENP
jgi:hypothetical protein